MYILVFFVKNKVPIGAWVYFWVFCLVPLVYISVFVPVPYCLDNCGFVVEHGTGTKTEILINRTKQKAQR